MSSDRISLKGMQFYGYHGVNPEEKENGQQFEIAIYIKLSYILSIDITYFLISCQFTVLYFFSKLS